MNPFQFNNSAEDQMHIATFGDIAFIYTSTISYEVIIRTTYDHQSERVLESIVMTMQQANEEIAKDERDREEP